MHNCVYGFFCDKMNTIYDNEYGKGTGECSMKFLHLSDLHIGKKVNEFSMLEDQEYILAQILTIIEEQNVEGVWIAGDIYDKPVPSAEAVKLFDDFLTNLAKKDIPVFVISGNHDSAERIAFGARLMNSRKVYVSPVFDGQIEPVVLQDDFGEIAVYMLPFVKPAIVRHAYPDALIESYQDAVKATITHMDIHAERRNVLIAHQFVTGAMRCESEEVSVGGVDKIEVDLFTQFDYVALGHIHGPQHIGRETVRYCGTPLKYSFSEVNHTKAALLVNLQEKGNITFATIPFVPKHDMRELKGTYMELTARDFYKEIPIDDYMHITLTDEEDIPEAIGKLSVIYPNIMRLEYDNQRTRMKQNIEDVPEIKEKTPLQLLNEFYELQNNQPLREEQAAYALSLFDKLQGAE